jgi:hypothetical protein
MNIEDIEVKENSEEQLEAIAGLPTKNFIFAEEINALVEAAKNNRPISFIDNLETIGESGLIYQTPDGQLYTWNGTNFVATSIDILPLNNTFNGRNTFMKNVSIMGENDNNGNALLISNFFNDFIAAFSNNRVTTLRQLVTDLSITANGGAIIQGQSRHFVLRVGLNGGIGGTAYIQTDDSSQHLSLATFTSGQRVSRLHVTQNGQVIIGNNAFTPSAGAQFSVNSTSQGSLPYPRMTQAQRLLITTPSIGLIVYQTDLVSGLYIFRETFGWSLYQPLPTDLIQGSGSLNFLPKYNNEGKLINSQLFDNGTNLGIGTTTPQSKLDVIGDAIINGHRIGRGVGDNSFNILFGSGSFGVNTTGIQNVVIGVSSMQANTTGSDNFALGSFTVRNNTIGVRNVGIGNSTLRDSTTANSNIGIGTATIQRNLQGHNNVGIGDTAGTLDVTANSVTNTSQSIFIGSNTRPLANNQANQIVIGHNAHGKGSNTVQIGNSAINETHLQGQIVIGKYTQAQRLNISSPVVGAMVYQTDGTAGLYIFKDGSGWTFVI